MLCLSGLIVGWRIHTDLPHALAGFALLLLFAFAMLWIGTLLGLLVRSPDAAQGVVFIIVFPLTFLASTFVPLDGLPPVLRDGRRRTTRSARRGGQPHAVRQSRWRRPRTPPWPLEHPVLSAFAVVLAIIASRRR